MLRFRPTRLVLCLAALAAFGVGVLAANRTISAALFVMEIAANGKFKPLDYVTLAPTHEERIITVHEKQITVEFFVPRGAQPRTGIIIYSPLTARAGPLGSQKIMAQGFAKLGYGVARVTSDQVVITPEDHERLLAAAEALKSRFPTLRDIGIVAFCAGTGPALHAIAEWPLAGITSFVVLYAPYFSLADQISWSRSGETTYARKTLAIKRGADVEPALHDFINAYELRSDDLAKDPLFQRFNMTHSPATWAPKIANHDVYIIHAMDDGIVPFTDAFKVRDALAAQNRVALVITDILEHTGFKPVTLNSLLSAYLPSLARLENMVFSLLLAHSPG